MLHYFDPSECIRGIQQLLVSDKKRIAFLFGAGTSVSRKNENSLTVPTVDQMTQDIVAIIKDKNNGNLFKAVDAIKKELVDIDKPFNIETLLSNIEEKICIIGGGTLNGLTKDNFIEFKKIICAEIHDIVSVHKDFNADTYLNMTQYDFATWVNSADRKYAIEIFTTNYDYLIEKGLEDNDVPYYDGFTGSYESFFNSLSLEDLNFLVQQTKLWKMHGSLGLKQDAVTGKITRGNSDDHDMLIYPSSMKYNNSKKQPYVAFMDRLNAFLKQDDAVLFVCGYSFGDEHINERIISALRSNTSAHVFVLNYDILYRNKEKTYSFTENCSLSEIAKRNRKISVLSSRTAVIGSIFGTWQLKREPDKDDSLNVSWYFDEDAPLNEDLPKNEEIKGNEIWTGEGELSLPNFQHFTSFLQKMIPTDNWKGKHSE